MTETGKGIQAVLDDTITVLKQVVGAHRPGLRTQAANRDDNLTLLTGRGESCHIILN
jgi:hypothetical protein